MPLFLCYEVTGTECTNLLKFHAEMLNLLLPLPCTNESHLRCLHPWWHSRNCYRNWTGDEAWCHRMLPSNTKWSASHVEIHRFINACLLCAVDGWCHLLTFGEVCLFVTFEICFPQLCNWSVCCQRATEALKHAEANKDQSLQWFPYHTLSPRL